VIVNGENEKEAEEGEGGVLEARPQYYGSSLFRAMQAGQGEHHDFEPHEPVSILSVDPLPTGHVTMIEVLEGKLELAGATEPVFGGAEGKVQEELKKAPPVQAGTIIK
jgi:hypothetical protein